MLETLRRFHDDPRAARVATEDTPTAGEIVTHVKGGGTVRLWDWLGQCERTIDRSLSLKVFGKVAPGARQPGLRLVAAPDSGVPDGETPREEGAEEGEG